MLKQAYKQQKTGDVTSSSKTRWRRRGQCGGGRGCWAGWGRLIGIVGFMGYFGIELSHVTALLSSIIIGVGVDFSIHYISQYRRLARTVRSDKLISEVIEDVGYPIILDAGSNMGFGALLFSVFLPIQNIGGLMVFAMVSTSIGTLTVLAALSELLKHKLIEKDDS